MPDARHRRPLKLFLYSRSVKINPRLFIIVLRRPRDQVSGKSFAKQWSLDFVPWRLALQGWLLLGIFALRASGLSRNRLFEFHKRRQFFIGVHNEPFRSSRCRFSLELRSGGFRRTSWEYKHQPASQRKKTFLHYYASLEAFLKAKWQMIRPPNRSTIRTDVYEIRPRADKHGVDLVTAALPYSPMWYRGPKAIRDAINHAKFSSRSRDAAIRVYDEAGNVIETHEHARDFKGSVNCS
jgi:hypothetical protein